MGTRGLIIVNRTPEIDETNELAVIYSQYDSYESYLGKMLKDFLKDGMLTNGISMATDSSGKMREINGMEDLAMQVIAHLKLMYVMATTSSLKTKTDLIKTPGGYYLERPGTRNVGEDYRYTIYPDADEGDKIRIRVDKKDYDSRTDEPVFNTVYDGMITDYQPTLEEI